MPATGRNDHLSTDRESNMTHGGENWAEKLLHQETYTPHELAELLDISEYRINQEVYKGNLEGRKIGDDIIDIPRAAVLDWLSRRGQ
jgi:hypothetical protein